MNNHVQVKTYVNLTFTDLVIALEDISKKDINTNMFSCWLVKKLQDVTKVISDKIKQKGCCPSYGERNFQSHECEKNNLTPRINMLEL